jgi:glycosyltransferase involved in cell wall biosynthesis
MKKELISIIVPVYQVKDYVEECINSLLNQTYSDIEILLIDDGSTDGSGEICDKYAEKDGRVQVFHQENKGLSAASTPK